MPENRPRIGSLDFLRGVAILGMLFVNIPWHAGTSMSRVNEADWSSVAAWLLQYVVVDQRFMPIFGMLFGAGFIILSEGRSNSAEFIPYVWRRMAILLAIGLAHAYLIWPGDILINYAFCGFLLLLFYKQSPKQLLIWGLFFKLTHLAFMQIPALYNETFHKLLFEWWLDIGPAPMSESDAYAGSYWDLFRYNVWRNQFIQWTAMLDYRIWNALSFMLVGMGLYKMNILSAAATRSFYYRLLLTSLGVGTPFLIYGVMGQIGENSSVGAFFGFEAELPLGSLAHNLGTSITAFAMLAGLLLWFKLDAQPRLIRLLQSVGRMALSNYVFQSLIFFVVFAMLELLPYDSLEPDTRLVWAIVIWIFQIAFSALWLRHFAMGPLEMLWRSLTGAGPARVR